ncbi:MAG: hypothetical protein F4Z57_22530 [Gemmatimonadetes bacterium]|nr:hypothetical protein [Gemmatimonadota bacterium]MYC71036.1 hypothetical protein [Gemmatimonadota bacterium]MYI61111.1 hypothetical protein [Gemmatimonadota bacterium]
MAREYILLEIKASKHLRYWSGDGDQAFADGLLSDTGTPIYTAVDMLTVQPLATAQSNATPTLTVDLCLPSTEAGYEPLRSDEQSLDCLVRLTDDLTLDTEIWRFRGRTRRRSLQAGRFTLELVHFAARLMEDDPNPELWNAERDKGFEYLRQTARRLNETTWPN